MHPLQTSKATELFTNQSNMPIILLNEMPTKYRKKENSDNAQHQKAHNIKA